MFYFLKVISSLVPKESLHNILKLSGSFRKNINEDVYVMEPFSWSLPDVILESY